MAPSSPAGPTERQLDLTVLDALRGLAALYVMLGHTASLLWAGPAAAEHGSRAAVLASLLAHHVFRWGHQAVLLFFIISGFCIHYRQARLLARSEADRGGTGRTATMPANLFDARSYAWRRFRRIYPTLLAALAITAACDALGAWINPDLYGGRTAYATINEHIGASSHSVTTLLGNLLLQASFAVPPFGTNGPLWSLSFECWFYLLYPALLWLSWRFGAARMIAAVGAVSALALALLPRQYPLPGGALVAAQVPVSPLPWVPWWALLMLTYWVVWAGGALIAEAYVGRLRLRGLRLLALPAAAAIATVALRYRFVTERPAWWQASSDLVLGAGFGVLLACALLRAPRWLGFGIERVAARLTVLGDLSYSLYAVHLPLLTLLSAWWLRSRPLPAGAELALAGAVSASALAWCCWYLVERHVATRAASRRVPITAARAVVAASTPASVPVLVPVVADVLRPAQPEVQDVALVAPATAA